jgi:hypothetical protein
VDFTIELDGETPLHAAEVDTKRTNGMLSAELQAS